MFEYVVGVFIKLLLGYVISNFNFFKRVLVLLQLLLVSYTCCFFHCCL